METQDFFDLEEEPDLEQRRPPERRPSRAALRPAAAGLWAVGERASWVGGLVLLLSSFMSWYSGSSLEGPTVAVIGWHTGTVGKLVFFVGLLIVALAVLRETGVELPPAVPESLVVIALGAIATILVLVRVISIPDTFADTAGRGIGLWIGLLAALTVTVAGLLRAGEEL